MMVAYGSFVAPPGAARSKRAPPSTCLRKERGSQLWGERQGGGYSSRGVEGTNVPEHDAKVLGFEVR